MDETWASEGEDEDEESTSSKSTESTTRDGTEKRKKISKEERSQSPDATNKKTFFSLKEFDSQDRGSKPTHDMIATEKEIVRKITETVIAEYKKSTEFVFSSIKFNAKKGKISYNSRQYIRHSPFKKVVRLAKLNLPHEFKKKIKNPGAVRDYIKTRFFEVVEDNVIAEDTLQLTHLPLVVDAVDDESVGVWLYQHYSNGIHGYLLNEYEINYEMLFYLMKKLLFESNHPHLIYFALYRVFPNYGSQLEFSQMFPKLVEQFCGGKGLLTLEGWKDQKDKEDHEFSNRNYLVKNFEINSANWGNLCSENCFKSVDLDDLPPSMRQVLNNTVGEQIVLFVKKSISIRNSQFLNALLNNKEKNIEKFCETVKKFGQQDCAECFSVLLGSCIPRNSIDASMLKSFKKRDQRFRSVMKNTSDELDENNETLDFICTVTSCAHLGPCGEGVAECNCDLMCTVYCKCDANCARKFVGCQCLKGQCKTKNCPCFKIGFECNKLTCGMCAYDKCKNREITIGVPKKVSVRHSKIAKAGNGLFMDEPAEKDEYLGEYCGEEISGSELERRGAVDKFSMSYIFSLGTKRGVDSSRVGNLFRFVNNSEHDPNCHVFYRNVEGKPRIGFCSSKKLNVGDELLFDYGYDDEHMQTFFKLRPEDRVKKTNSPPVKFVEEKEKEKVEMMKMKDVDFSLDVSDLTNTKTRTGRVTKRRTYVSL